MAGEIRRLLAAVTGRGELLALPADAALFGTGVGLDSLTGTLLLREIRLRYGVDVAADDLNLDSLATLATLTGFVAARAAQPGGSRPGGDEAGGG
jgi:acyl carrier protein